MTVYVDDAFIPAMVKNGNRRIASKWCHMTADTTEELIAMAKAIGLHPRYIQHPGTWKEHFDVTLNRRKHAVLLGAVEVSYHDHVKWMSQRRDKLNQG